MEIDFDKARIDLKKDGTWMSLHVGNRLKACDIVSGLADKMYTATIKLKRKKRSRNANAYFWKLLDELAAATRIGKEQMQRKRYPNRNAGGNSGIKGGLGQCIK